MQPRQREVGQQRYRAFAETTQIAAHPDHAIKGRIDQCPAIETVAGQWLLRLALRAVIRAITVGIGVASQYCWMEPANGCRICMGAFPGVVETP